MCFGSHGCLQPVLRSNRRLEFAVSIDRDSFCYKPLVPAAPKGCKQPGLPRCRHQGATATQLRQSETGIAVAGTALRSVTSTTLFRSHSLRLVERFRDVCGTFLDGLCLKARSHRSRRDVFRQSNGFPVDVHLVDSPLVVNQDHSGE